MKNKDISSAIRCGGRGSTDRRSWDLVSVIGGVGEKKSNNGTQWYEQDRIYDAENVATSIPAEKSFHPYYGIKWMSPEMQRYIVAKPSGKYESAENNYQLNRSPTGCITTREGVMRAHISTYISPDCGENTKITRDEKGFPIPKGWDPKRGEDMGENQPRLRIRKLTPDECMRLMAFEQKDTDAMREAGLSNSIIYHSAGDSIVSSVLVGIFAKMLGINPKEALENHAERLAGEGSSGGIIVDDIYKNRKEREYENYGPSLRCNCGELKVKE